MLEGGTAEIVLLDRSSRVWMKVSTESKGDERAQVGELIVLVGAS